MTDRPLRLAFMGTPDFSVPVLKALIDAGHTIVAVYCQPPRPAGRGQKERKCPVHVAADGYGIEVRTPETLKKAEEQARFAALDLDAAVVVAYGLILPKEFLEAPKLGCINVHASLLPRWRGAAPIQRAIEAGDEETGVTIMLMDEGLDTGDMLMDDAIGIGPETTGGTLHDSLSELGARLIVPALEGLANGTLKPRPQPLEGATYAAKFGKNEGHINWTRDAKDLERHVRAFAPWPGAWTDLEGTRLKVLAAELASGQGTAGTILDDKLTVACGTGALRLTRVQLAGKAAMTASEFLRGRSVLPGTQLG